MFKPAIKNLLMRHPIYVIIFTLIISFHTGEVHAQNDSTMQWTPEQMIGLETVSDPVLSPDGEYIAYEVRETLMEGEKSEFLTHVWVVKTDGSTNRQYTRGNKSATNPSFSPDGRYLAFLSNRNGEHRQVYQMYLDGGEAVQVTHAENGVNSYQWSPDGSRIAFTMTDPKTEEEKEREKEKRDVHLVDQEYRFNHLYVETVFEDPEKNSVKQVTSGDMSVNSFDWSPDGRTIVFSHHPTPKIDDLFFNTDISLVPADSGTVKELVTWEGADGSPHFSPNGQFVVFESQGGTPEPIGLSDVYRVPVEGGTPQPLAHTPDRNANIVDWAPGGKSLLVTEVRHTYTALYRLPVDGSPPTQVTPEDGVYSDFSISDNGSLLAFKFEQPETPENIYVSGLQSFKKRQLTDIYHDEQFPAMGRTELVRWKSEDGLEIEGLLTYPVDYREGRRYPLILNVHGGPAGVYLQSFTGSGSIYPIQFFASRGFAVLRPNPRGSTGYGKSFRYDNYRDWGYGDYEDLMSGVDKVIEMGVAHPDSLVEMGWSYGGYMTSFIVTRTDRFKAVSMGAGLPNLISMVNTTDIPTYLAAHMGGYYWESEKLEEIYERHSAIYRLKEISTPVQVLHGVHDDRVPTSQGKEFYWALKKRGVPTELILYPRTPHGPREPKLIADVPHRILTWFNRYLDRD